MGASQTVLPFELAASDKSLTAQSGVTFVVCRISASNGRLRPDLRPPRSQMSRTSVLSSISGVHQDGLVHVSQLAERFVVEMPAGIVLAASGEHNDALLRRGHWIGSKKQIPSAWRRRTAHES
jgi:hypothetical protein